MYVLYVPKLTRSFHGESTGIPQDRRDFRSIILVLFAFFVTRSDVVTSTIDTCWV